MPFVPLTDDQVRAKVADIYDDEDGEFSMAFNFIAEQMCAFSAELDQMFEKMEPVPNHLGDDIWTIDIEGDFTIEDCKQFLALCEQFKVAKEATWSVVEEAVVAELFSNVHDVMDFSD